jgi:hypothetical protein
MVAIFDQTNHQSTDYVAVQVLLTLLRIFETNRIAGIREQKNQNILACTARGMGLTYCRQYH